MKKRLFGQLFSWKFDIAMILIVVIGFQIIDHSLTQIEQESFYFEFIATAKWLLIGGFALHGVINWFSAKG